MPDTASVERPVGTAERKRSEQILVWQTSEDVDGTTARIAAGIEGRIGSWIDGNQFQVAMSPDPCTPVLVGTIRSRPHGAEITAVISCRQEVQDILKLGRFLLLGFIVLLAFCLPLPQLGRELGVVFAAVALAAVVALGLASVFEAHMLNGKRRADYARELTLRMRRLLYS